MSIIEQAAKRLEELRRSGVDLTVPPSLRDAGAAPGTVEPVIPRLMGRTRDAATAMAEAGTPDELRRPDEKRVERASGRRSQHVHIDLARLAAAGCITPDAARSQLADEFRVIKRPLLTNVQGKSAAPVARANLIMVTSSVPGEGKTFVATNLALSIAMELDRTVLLVDADVSRPSMLERLGLPPSKGLLDVLTDRALELPDVLLRTNVERLSLLPAGTAHARATELLASDAMNGLLDELATRYPDRIVIFDAPPLLPSTESRVLATHMGQVVVVVEAERTPQASVMQALATVESCPVVMTMLNKVPHSRLGAYYGYYGQYGY
ncbi:MAG: XrtA-associated tyrosine autokinase [Burkholderiaceae bacterium]